MLYNLNWLSDDKEFPPKEEADRIVSYKYLKNLFDIDIFKDLENVGSRLIANFDEYFRMPLLLGYQRLTTIKLCDMVLGAPPSITVNDNDEMTDMISDIRDNTDFDAKLYEAMIDYSRYGCTVLRIFNDDDFEEDRGNFTAWDPAEWYMILKNDGTKRIQEHVLAWKYNAGTTLNPDWYLDVQRHPIKGQEYYEEKYRLDGTGTHIAEKVGATIAHPTVDLPCMIQFIANLPSSSNKYGTSDYKIFNELVFKATERIRQILHILDEHADPSMTGPTTLLTTNESTGELEFKTSKFYGTSPGEEHPEYMTWDGKLDSAFKALEILLNEIYKMSEMGEAFLGNTQGAGQAISGTAMRYKMISPLEKARRVSNAFTLPIKKLMAALIQINTGKKVKYQDINVIWEDPLPKDPRETAELTRLQTGAPQIIPLKHALMENYDMDTTDAEHFIKEIKGDQEMWSKLKEAIQAQQKAAEGLSSGDGTSRPGEAGNPAAPINVNKKGSEKEPHKTGTKSTTRRDEDSE